MKQQRRALPFSRPLSFASRSVRRSLVSFSLFLSLKLRNTHQEVDHARFLAQPLTGQAEALARRGAAAGCYYCGCCDDDDDDNNTCSSCSHDAPARPHAPVPRGYRGRNHHYSTSSFSSSPSDHRVTLQTLCRRERQQQQWCQGQASQQRLCRSPPFFRWRPPEGP